VDGNFKAGDLFIQSMEEIMSSPVSGIARSGKTRSSKRSLSDLTLFGAGKKGAPMLHFDHSIHSLLAHDLYDILVGEVVTPFDGIEGVSFPAILDGNGNVRQSRVDPTLGGGRVRSQGMNLGEDSHLPASLLNLDGCPQTCKPATNHQCVIIEDIQEGPQGSILEKVN